MVQIDQTSTNFSKNICHVVLVMDFGGCFFSSFSFGLLFSPGFQVSEAAGLDP